MGTCSVLNDPIHVFEDMVPIGALDLEDTARTRTSQVVQVLILASVKDRSRQKTPSRKVKTLGRRQHHTTPPRTSASLPEGI